MLPCAAAGQHEHNRGEHRPIVDPQHPTTLGRVFAGGINGSTSAHNSSGTNQRDNLPIMRGDHEAKPSMIQVRRS